MKRALLIFSASFLFSIPFFGNEPLHVDFFGVFSDSHSIDKNMLDMTKNLYYTQLQEMANITVTDKSNTLPDTAAGSNSGEPPVFDPVAVDGADSGKIAFFAEIKEHEADVSSWTCTLYAQNLQTGRKVSVTNEYSSYYRILTDAKNSIENVLSRLQTDTSGKAEQSSTDQQFSVPVVPSTTESIAGTWYGEEYIDKIVILRGGRGFIIYKNGAAMNITVSVKKDPRQETAVTIVQAGKSNASYFPELPREIALDNAPSAPPVEWQFILISSGTLKGSKTTLITDPASPTGASKGIIEVTWTRR
jgi:hypothetical protein